MICRHARKGIVTNQTGPYDSTRPHAAADVCDRPACILNMGRWVSGKTGEPAYFQSDRDRGRWVAVNDGTP